MPSMSADDEHDLASLIAFGSNGEILECLERRAKRGNVELKEKLLYGVLLLFPPFAEPESAKQVIGPLLESSLRFDAAVWDAFRYATQMPDENRAFERVLTAYSRSAVASHMMSQIALAEGRFDEFAQLNHASRMIRKFPSNILAALENGLDPRQEEALKLAFNDLVISRQAENDTAVTSVEGLLDRLWDNQITGTRLTRPYVEYLKERGII